MPKVDGRNDEVAIYRYDRSLNGTGGVKGGGHDVEAQRNTCKVPCLSSVSVKTKRGTSLLMPKVDSRNNEVAICRYDRSLNGTGGVKGGGHDVEAQRVK